jgi:hypothetical protein
MRIAMLISAVICLALGVFPTFIIGWMGNLSSQLTGRTIAKSTDGMGWMWLTPVAAERASYSAPLVFLGVISTVAVVYLLLHVRKSAIHRVPLWDCGFKKITPAMQYTSTSFSMPSRVIFGYLFRIKESVKPDLSGGRAPQYPVKLRYGLKVRDRIWGWVYKPVADYAFRLAELSAKLQHGRIHIYLSYSFFTILFLLLFAL